MKKILLTFTTISIMSLAGDFQDGVKAIGEGNYKKAITLYQKAANKGDADAQYMHGVMHYKGLGLTRNYKKAVLIWRKLANEGHADARHILGVMYQYGDGVRQNYSTAQEFFSQACDSGDNDGCKQYAILNQK